MIRWHGGSAGKSLRAVLFSLCVFASCHGFALTDYYFTGSDACWTDSVWSATNGGSPIPGFCPGAQPQERAMFAGAQRVTIPEGEFDTYANFCVNLSSVGKEFFFDGRDNVFRMAACDADTWSSEPFSVKYGGSHFFNMQLYTVSDLRYRRALLTVTNGFMAASMPVLNAMTIDFKKGFWNFYDPVPGQTPTEEVNVVLFNAANNFASVFVDGDNGAKMRFSSLYIRGNSWTNELTFAGGSHEIMGRLSFPYNNCNSRNTDTRFTVTSNAMLHVEGATTFGYVDTYYNTSNRVYKFLVDKDSTAEFKGQFYTKEICGLDLAAREGGKLVFGAGNNTVHYLGGKNLVTAKVEVVDAKLDMRDTFVLGGGYSQYNQKIVPDSLAYASLYASNSVINSGFGSEGSTQLYVVNADMEVLDSQWSSRNLYLGYAGCRARVAVKGGRFDHAGHFRLGCQGLGNAEFSFEGGEGSIKPLSATDFQLGAAPGSESLICISGGKLFFDLSSAANSCILGYTSNSTGVVHQTGGEFNISGSGGLVVGNQGKGVYEMQGGSLTTKQIRIGFSSHDREEHVFRQSGGYVDVQSSGIYYGVNVCDADALGRLVLDGGVMRCNSIRGWTGSASKGGKGWAVLEADGGTLRASENSSVQIQNFDEAWLGDKGLTVESDYSITIAQAFADKEGEEGLLALSGNGEKTLSATNSVQSRLTATGGIVKFAQTAGVDASHSSHAAFSGGSGVSLVGAQTSVRFRSLALGDASSFVRIALDIGDCVSSETAIDSLSQVKLSFAGTPPMGTHTVLRCKGAVSDDVRANWMTRSEFVSSKPEGAKVAFKLDYDDQADETAFSVVFSAYAGEIAPDNVVSVSTNIGGTATADAMRFDSTGGDKIVGGDGTLELADCGLDSIVVESGHHEIALSLALPCGTMARTTIAEGASLDITGAILRGGIEKLGLGRLELSAHNGLGIGFVHDGGTSVLKHGDSAGTGMLTVRDGTLVFAPENENEEMRLATTVQISPSVSPTNAVVLKADGDTVISMVSAPSGRGALIKRGAGRLTIEEKKLLSVVNSSGFAKVNQQYSASNELEMPANGSVPSGFPYSGINVIEGELRFKGASGDKSVKDSVNAFKSLVSMTVGLNTRNVASAPGMVVDNAVCNFNNGSRHLNIGSGLSETVYGGAGDPYLLVTNNSSLIVNTLNFAWDSTHPTVKPRLVADASSVTCSYMFQPNRGTKVPLEHVFRNGSALYGNITFECESTLIFDNSICAKDSALSCARLYQEWGNNCWNRAKGTLVFRNGGKLYCNALAASVNASYPVKHDLTVRFDNGEWIPAHTNFICSGAIQGDPDKLVLESSGDGLVMAPGAGITWVLDVAVSGEGGLVKRGEGVLELDQSAVRYSGVTRVEQGVLSLGSKRLSGIVLAGPGTVDGGELTASAIRLDISGGLDGAETPFFGDGLTFGGSFPAVDLGLSDENPLPRPFRRFAVARYGAQGEAPASGVCRIRNSGHKSMRGKIECEDGVVYVTPYLAGFSVLVR